MFETKITMLSYVILEFIAKSYLNCIYPYVLQLMLKCSVLQELSSKNWRDTLQRTFNKTFSRLNKPFLHFPPTFCTHDGIILYSGLIDGSVIDTLLINAVGKNNVGFHALIINRLFIFFRQVKGSNYRKNGRILSIRHHRLFYFFWTELRTCCASKKEK